MAFARPLSLSFSYVYPFLSFVFFPPSSSSSIHPNITRVTSAEEEEEEQILVRLVHRPLVSRFVSSFSSSSSSDFDLFDMLGNPITNGAHARPALRSLSLLLLEPGAIFWRID